MDAFGRLDVLVTNAGVPRNKSILTMTANDFGQTNYAAAKTGITGMVLTWALEMKRGGGTANAEA